VIFKDFQMYFIYFAFIYCFYSLNVCNTMYGIFSLHFHLCFAISWYYCAIHWVSMNETPVYNAVLLEVRVKLLAAHYVTVIQTATGHLYHHTRVGSLSNWVLLHKLIFCELFLLYRVII